MSAPTLGDCGTAAQTNVAAMTRTDLVVHVLTPQQNTGAAQRPSVSLSVKSAQDRDIREKFYLWRQTVVLSEDFKALQGDSERLKTFVEQKLLASEEFGSETFSTSVVLNPPQTGMDKTTNGIQLEGSNRFVDLAITGLRLSLETGHVLFSVRTPYISVRDEVVVGISAIVTNALRNRFFTAGGISNILESGARGSDLEDKVVEELGTFFESLYQTQGWDYKNSYIAYDMKRLSDQRLKKVTVGAEPASVGDGPDKAKMDT